MKRLRNGKIDEKLWDYLARLHQHQPEAFESGGYLRAMVARDWAELNNKKKCPNCDANMYEGVAQLDWHNAALLSSMGNVIKQRLREGMEFKEANAVHVVSANISDALRHRTSLTSKLGLIAKVRTEKGTHDTTRGWLITKRGWAALRGEEVPAEVITWRGKIYERTDKVSTIFIALTTPPKKTNSKMSDEERQGIVDAYHPSNYYQLGKAHQGKML